VGSAPFPVSLVEGKTDAGLISEAKPTGSLSSRADREGNCLVQRGPLQASSAKLALGVPKNLEHRIEWQSPWLSRRSGVKFNAPYLVFVIYLRKLFIADEHFGNETITIGRA